MALAVVLARRLRAPLAVAYPAGMMVTLAIPTIFLWSPAGLLTPWPVLVQSAELVGERGTSALFALFAALVWGGIRDARAHRGRALAHAIGAVALAAIVLVQGVLAMRREREEEAALGSERRPPIALVQAAVDPKFRWVPGNAPIILERLKEQTRLAEAERVALSIWPEAAYPHVLPHGAQRMPRGERSPLGDGVRGPLLIGLLTADPAEPGPDGVLVRNLYNSATIVQPDGRLAAPHDKMHLLWYGETLPLAEYIPPLRRAFQRSGGLAPGAELRALEIAPAD
jgi:apolipoprotein N-acyltransferase